MKTDPEILKARHRERSYRYGRETRMEEMLIKTRGKLDMLIKEAKFYGMHDLLTNAERNKP